MFWRRGAKFQTNANHTVAGLLRLGQVKMRKNESCTRANVGKNED
jgi:hypothetical protein